MCQNDPEDEFERHIFAQSVSIPQWHTLDQTTGLPSSVCVVDCAINGFIGDQISLSKGDGLGF